MSSEIATLRKLLNESLDVLEAENKKAGNPAFTLSPIVHPIDDTDSKVVTPRFYLARRAAIGAMQQLTGLIQPVADKITTDSIACLQTAAVAAISRSGIFNILAAKDVDVQKGLSVSEIQQRVEEPKRFSDKNLPRFLRLAAALGWLKETSPDVFALTRPALVLGTNPCAAAFFDSLALQNMRATPAFYDNATDPKTRESESAAEATWSRAMRQHLKEGQSIWDYFGVQAPHEMEQFGMGMSYGVGTTAAVIADFPWEELTGTIVDVGGGRGSLSLPMLKKANKDLKLIIQDRPEVAELAKANIAQNWTQYGDRVSAEGHDFFQKNPRSGEGINYMMRWILHDWSDTDCIKILSAISSVMHKDSRIIVIDAIVTPGPGTNTLEGFLESLKKADDQKFELVEPPAPLSKAWDDAKTLRSLDMLMGAWFNARERTEAQFAAIADAAGLKIHKVYPARACHWVTEYRLK